MVRKKLLSTNITNKYQHIPCNYAKPRRKMLFSSEWQLIHGSRFEVSVLWAPCRCPQCHVQSPSVPPTWSLSLCRYSRHHRCVVDLSRLWREWNYRGYPWIPFPPHKAKSKWWQAWCFFRIWSPLKAKLWSGRKCLLKLQVSWFGRSWIFSSQLRISS